MQPRQRKDQQGSALVVCLMVLGVLTLLGTTAILNTTTETKITHNSRKSEKAFFAAESGIEFLRKLSVEDIKSGTWTPAMSTLGCTVKVAAIIDLGDYLDAYRISFESVGRDASSARRIIRADVQIAPRKGGSVIRQGEIGDLY